MLSFCKLVLQTFGMLFFLVFIGGVFVAVTVMLGKPELFFLVIFLLAGCLIKSSISGRKTLAYFQELPLVGDATRILDSLEHFYKSHAPKTIVYYLLYPITSVIGFFFCSRVIRGELAKYFSLIHWIILILFIEGFLRSYQLYGAFGLTFTVKWCILEFILVYFLCNFFAIPLLVCTIRLTLAQCYRRLLFITASTFLCLGGFFYCFSVVYQFDNLIPTTIILEKNLSQPPEDPNSFIGKLEKSTSMFLQHYLPDLQKDLQKEKDPKVLLRQCNEEYQQTLLSICPYEENRIFYLTTNSDVDDLWGCVFVPIRESLFFTFHYANNKLDIYRHMSKEEQEKFKLRWDKNIYRASYIKQLGRVVLEETSRAFKQLDQQPESQSKMKKQAEAVSQEMSMPKIRSEYVKSEKSTDLDQLPKFGNALDQEIANLFQNFKNLQVTVEEKHRKPSERHLRGLLQQLENFLFSEPTTVDGDILLLIQKIQVNWPPECTLPSQIEFVSSIKSLQAKEMEIQQLLRQCMRDQETIRYTKEEALNDFKVSLENLHKIIVSEEQNSYLVCAKKIQSEFEHYVHSYRFVVYDEALTTFNFHKALEFRLIADHKGKGPEARSENIMTKIFGAILQLLLLFFGLCMPLHVGLIIYAYWHYFDNVKFQTQESQMQGECFLLFKPSDR